MLSEEANSKSEGLQQKCSALEKVTRSPFQPHYMAVCHWTGRPQFNSHLAEKYRSTEKGKAAISLLPRQEPRQSRGQGKECFAQLLGSDKSNLGISLGKLFLSYFPSIGAFSPCREKNNAVLQHPFHSPASSSQGGQQSRIYFPQCCAESDVKL